MVEGTKERAPSSLHRLLGELGNHCLTLWQQPDSTVRMRESSEEEIKKQ